MLAVRALMPEAGLVELRYPRSAWAALSRTMANRMEVFPDGADAAVRVPVVLSPLGAEFIRAFLVNALDANGKPLGRAEGDALYPALIAEVAALRAVDRAAADRAPIALASAIGFADYAEMPEVLDALCEYAAQRLLEDADYFACTIAERVRTMRDRKPAKLQCAACDEPAAGACGACATAAVYCSAACLGASHACPPPVSLGFQYPTAGTPCAEDLLFPNWTAWALGKPLGSFNEVERALILNHCAPWAWIKAWLVDPVDTGRQRELAERIVHYFPGAFNVSREVLATLVKSMVGSKGELFGTKTLVRDAALVQFVLGYRNAARPDRAASAADVEALALTAISANVPAALAAALADARFPAALALRPDMLWVTAGAAGSAPTVAAMLADARLRAQLAARPLPAVVAALRTDNLDALAALLQSGACDQLRIGPEVVKNSYTGALTATLAALIKSGPFIADPEALFLEAVDHADDATMRALLASPYARPWLALETMLLMFVRHGQVPAAVRAAALLLRETDVLVNATSNRAREIITLVRRAAPGAPLRQAVAAEMKRRGIVL